LLIDYEEVTEGYMEVARAYDSGNVGEGGKGGNVGKGGKASKGGKGGNVGKKRLASPSRDAPAGPIGARRTSRSDRSAGGSAGGSSRGISTPAERLSNLLLGSGEDPGLDCRAIIHIVKHCHSNIIDISFVWHCL
jgi:hypothetical protein